MKQFLACLLCTILLCTARANGQTSGQDLRVYGATLLDFDHSYHGRPLLIFSDRTDTPRRVLCVTKDLAEFIGMCETNDFAVDHALAAEFYEKNQRPRPLPRRFRLGFAARIKTISADRQKAIFSGGAKRGWKRFARAYPNGTGIYYLSRVAYSADGLNALVYVGWAGDSFDCGTIYLLRRQRSSWKKVRDLTTWIS